MAQMHQAVAMLKLTLAEIRCEEEKLDIVIGQFETQLVRLPRQTMYGRVSLDLALNAMGEVEERLRHAQTNREHLLAIRQRAQKELEALEVVQRVEEARASLSKLKAMMSVDQDGETNTHQQIRRLEEYITQYSKQAERAIITMAEGGRTR